MKPGYFEDSGREGLAPWSLVRLTPVSLVSPVSLGSPVTLVSPVRPKSYSESSKSAQVH